MTSVKDKTRTIRGCVVSIAPSIAFGSVIASLERLSAQNQKPSGSTDSSKQMADGKLWTTHSLNVNVVPSYCYEDGVWSKNLNEGRSLAQGIRSLL